MTGAMVCAVLQTGDEIDLGGGVYATVLSVEIGGLVNTRRIIEARRSDSGAVVTLNRHRDDSVWVIR